MAIQLKAGKWKKVGAWYGTSSRKLRIDVTTNQQCKWRRKTVWAPTGSGSFVDQKVVTLWNSWVDVKSPVDTSCATQFV
jgi:hypothetical protein